MFEVEPEVFRGVVPPMAWQRAVESFDGRGVRSEEYLGDAPWRAAGLIDEDGYLRDAWLEALITVRNANFSALIIARRDQVEYRTECVCDDRKVVLTTGRGALEDNRLAGIEPVVEVFCAPLDRASQLIRRALPPEFAQPNLEAEPLSHKLQIGPDPAHLPRKADQARRQIDEELERDPIMQLASQMHIQVALMVSRNGRNRSYFWFSDGNTFLRHEGRDTYRVDDADLLRTLNAELRSL